MQNRQEAKGDNHQLMQAPKQAEPDVLKDMK